MRNMRILEANHENAELRQPKPLRHLAAEHTALASAFGACALAGDDEHEARAASARFAQKMQQCRMRLSLREPVQIETSIDRLFTARDTLLHAATKWC
jgi:hypothetical protein